jgi:hypothetical protein
MSDGPVQAVARQEMSGDDAVSEYETL